jgi:hypothetical protein
MLILVHVKEQLYQCHVPITEDLECPHGYYYDCCTQCYMTEDIILHFYTNHKIVWDSEELIAICSECNKRWTKEELAQAQIQMIVLSDKCANSEKDIVELQSTGNTKILRKVDLS